MLHILQLGPYPPPEGGISRNMLAIRDEIRARGHKCSIIATSKSSRIENEPDVYHPGSAFALIKLLTTLKFDVLHLHIGGDVSLRVLTLAFAASAFGRNKSVLTLHSGEYPQTREGLMARPGSIRGLIFRRFSRIVAVNEPIADVFRCYGVTADRIKVILPYALKRPDDTVTVPAELSGFCKDHSPMLLAVGGLEKDYDPLFQIAAMKDILVNFPDAGLMIVGDGSMRDEVEKAVEASGFAGHIYLAGNVEHAVTLHLINDADILLRTTLFDGDAISIREALFLGTSVIASDNGMRPGGVHLVPMRAADALVKEIMIAASNTKGSNIDKPDHRSNIDAVLELYAELTDVRSN